MASREWTDDGDSFNGARFNSEFQKQVASDPPFAVEMLNEATEAQVAALDCEAISTLLTNSGLSRTDRINIITALGKVGPCRSYDFQ